MLDIQYCTDMTIQKFDDVEECNENHREENQHLFPLFHLIIHCGYHFHLIHPIYQCQYLVDDKITIGNLFSQQLF